MKEEKFTGGENFESHLQLGVKPIMACLEENGEDDTNLKKFKDGSFFANESELKNVDYFAPSWKLNKKGFKNAGDKTFVISTLDEKNKYTEGLADCTTVVASGKQKQTGKEISFVTHQDPDYFLKNQKVFLDELRSKLSELKESCEERTVDAVVAGGWYLMNEKDEKENKEHQENYRNSITLLSEEIHHVLGFEPVIITGPKKEDDIDNVFYDTQKRRLYIFRPSVGNPTEESYRANDIDTEKEKWK